MVLPYAGKPAEEAFCDGVFAILERSPWRFTGGTIRRVAVDVSGEAYIDLEREAAAMLMRE